MDRRRCTRSSCPSRLPRSHPWSWQSRMGRWWYHQNKQQSRWTPASILSRSPPPRSPSYQDCEDSCQGGLVRWGYLWLSRWTQNGFPPLTFTATAICRAKWGVLWLPESGSSRWLGSTSHVNVTLAAAAVTSASLSVNEVLVEAILGSSRCDTDVARCWGQRWTFWTRLKVKSPIWISTQYQRLPWIHCSSLLIFAHVEVLV